MEASADVLRLLDAEKNRTHHYRFVSLLPKKHNRFYRSFENEKNTANEFPSVRYVSLYKNCNLRKEGNPCGKSKK